MGNDTYVQHKDSPVWAKGGDHDKHALWVVG